MCVVGDRISAIFPRLVWVVCIGITTIRGARADSARG
jgi:hypothetical protein